MWISIDRLKITEFFPISGNNSNYPLNNWKNIKIVVELFINRKQNCSFYSINYLHKIKWNHFIPAQVYDSGLFASVKCEGTGKISYWDMLIILNILWIFHKNIVIN